MTPHPRSAFGQIRPGAILAQVRNLLGFPKRPGIPVTPANSDRQVLDDPRDAWQLWFPRNLTVQQVVTILRASRLGDQWQLASLVEVMLDSWPMLKKCQHELRASISRTKFSVHAYTVNGKKPTNRAQQKADLVQRAMTSYRPNPAVTDERGFPGMVYDLANAYLLGPALVELQWNNKGRPDSNGDILPRSASFCHPAHVVLDDNANIQIATTRNGSTIPLDPNFFLTSVFQSQSGSVYSMGMVRSVGWWWAVMLAVQEWMFGGAQKYGAPYVFLTYARELMGNSIELAKIKEALMNSGANRFIMTPEGTVADLKPPGSLGPDNPQRYMKEQADKEVQMLFLGQTSSTQSEPGKLGNNDQHMEVRSEHKESVAKWMGDVLTQQWATAILRRNYGTDDESPTIEPDFTEVETRMEAAQRIAVEVNTGLPMIAEEVYNDLNRRVPQEGDQVVQRGQLGVMSDPAETPIQPSLEEQVEQQSMIAEASGQFDEPVQARERVMASYFEEHKHPRGEHGHFATKDERETAIARIKEIATKTKWYSDKGGLTREEAGRYRELNKEANDLRFRWARPAHADTIKIQSPEERKSTLPVQVVVAARNDLMAHKGVYDAVIESGIGVYHNANTPIDEIMLGGNRTVSPQDLYSAFSRTREEMRKHYGPTVTLFRATGAQKEKPTKNWATTKAFAEQFGKNIVQAEIPIDHVIAVNVGLVGNYHEVVVGNPPSHNVAKAKEIKRTWVVLRSKEVSNG